VAQQLYQTLANRLCEVACGEGRDTGAKNAACAAVTAHLRERVAVGDHRRRVVIRWPFLKKMLHNHFIAEIFLKKSGEVKDSKIVNLSRIDKNVYKSLGFKNKSICQTMIKEVLQTKVTNFKTIPALVQHLKLRISNLINMGFEVNDKKNINNSKV
jgi:hypothetical protein